MDTKQIEEAIKIFEDIKSFREYCFEGVVDNLLNDAMETLDSIISHLESDI